MVYADRLLVNYLLYVTEKKYKIVIRYTAKKIADDTSVVSSRAMTSRNS